MSVSVSVVVPVYNPGKHLEPCIDSLLRQSMPADRLELIFVDDGSTDESPAAARPAGRRARRTCG